MWLKANVTEHKKMPYTLLLLKTIAHCSPLTLNFGVHGSDCTIHDIANDIKYVILT